MGSVHLMGKSFGPEAIHAMSAAFDSAWQDLEASGNIFSSGFTAVWAARKDRRAHSHHGALWRTRSRPSQ
jgi:hypothetical protein